MKNEKLFEAMTDIDEKYIAEAKAKTIKAKKKPFVKWLAMAACFAAILGVGIGIARSGWFGKSPSAEIDTTSEAKSNSAVSLTSEERKTNAAENKSEAVTTVIGSSVNESTSTKNPSVQSTTSPKQDSQSNPDESKGGDTAERLQDYRIGTDGGNYRAFKPGVDKFEPLDHMTLENRFCAFQYNGRSYYPVPDGDITKDDYEQDKLASVKAEHWELRSANADDETDGIIYYARIDIYKLKGVEPSEAVACVISFNGETKEYRYNAA